MQRDRPKMQRQFMYCSLSFGKYSCRFSKFNKQFYLHVRIIYSLQMAITVYRVIDIDVRSSVDALDKADSPLVLLNILRTKISIKKKHLYIILHKFPFVCASFPHLSNLIIILKPERKFPNALQNLHFPFRVIVSLVLV